ncbi:hypothetical protein B0H19DRAFT_1272010 [Mycena capillaripes]|nr:hypothetical protein B0H19DRAFT_1272010 [Mycena capillaripes]
MRDLSFPANLALKCPFLTNAFVSCYVTPEVPEELHLAVRNSTSRFVRGLSRVERLCVSDSLNEFIASVRSPPVFGIHLFPHLEEICLSPGNTEIAIGWLKTLGNSRIREFTLSFNSVTTVTDAAALYASLADNLPRASLHTLEIDGALTLDTDQLSAASPSQYAIKSRALQRLFCFQNLLSVSLQVCGGLDLDDSLILGVGRAWPHLQVLLLTPGCPTHVQCRVTLGGLRVLACHCPNLSSVGIEIDATVIPQSESATHQNTHTNLTKIHLGHSPIFEVSPVARFIFALFPELSKIGTRTFYAAEDEEPEVNIFRTRWAAVAEEIHVKRLQAGLKPEQLALPSVLDRPDSY